MANKRVLYTVSAVSLALLLVSMFLPGELSGRISAATLLLCLAILTHVYVKKRGIPSVNKGEVLTVLAVTALVYVAVYYMTGLKFGFYRNLDMLSLGHIIPVTVIIISSEHIRKIIMAQEDRPAEILCYFSLVIAETLILGNVSYVTTFNKFMNLVAVVFLPSLVANLLYHYLSRRYGAKPIVVYRLITTLYAYLIPIKPALSDSIVSFIKLVIPILIYVFIDTLYERKRRYALEKKSKLAIPITVLAVVCMASVVMLISNQFRFGTLVIATESMTGEINKGDVVIFDQEDGQIYEEGQVIVFEKYDITVVHRIIKIERINGQNRYYTKGDANEGEDSGYITDDDIIGSAVSRLPFIGYPTLWLRDIVSSNVHR